MAMRVLHWKSHSSHRRMAPPRGPLADLPADADAAEAASEAADTIALLASSFSNSDHEPGVLLAEDDDEEDEDDDDDMEAAAVAMAAAAAAAAAESSAFLPEAAEDEEEDKDAPPVMSCETAVHAARAAEATDAVTPAGTFCDWTVAETAAAAAATLSAAVARGLRAFLAADAVASASASAALALAPAPAPVGAMAATAAATAASSNASSAGLAAILRFLLAAAGAAAAGVGATAASATTAAALVVAAAAGAAAGALMSCAFFGIVCIRVARERGMSVAHVGDWRIKNFQKKTGAQAEKRNRIRRAIVRKSSYILRRAFIHLNTSPRSLTTHVARGLCAQDAPREGDLARREPAGACCA
jgi:hypothetical protein